MLTAVRTDGDLRVLGRMRRDMPRLYRLKGFTILGRHHLHKPW